MVNVLIKNLRIIDAKSNQFEWFHWRRICRSSNVVFAAAHLLPHLFHSCHFFHPLFLFRTNLSVYFPPVTNLSGCFLLDLCLHTILKFKFLAWFDCLGFNSLTSYNSSYLSISQNWTCCGDQHKVWLLFLAPCSFFALFAVSFVYILSVSSWLQMLWMAVNTQSRCGGTFCSTRQLFVSFIMLPTAPK